MVLAPDSRYRSRKFIVAVGSLFTASMLAGFGMVELAEDGGDAALILGSWGAANAAILKLYNDANVKDE